MNQKINLKEDIYIFFANKNVECFFKKLSDLEEEVKSHLKVNPLDVKWMTIQSQILYKYNSNYKLALQVIKSILQVYPDNIDARLDLINILMEYFYERQTISKQLLDECYSLDSDYWRTYYINGLYYDKLFLEKESRAVLMEGLQKHPDNVWMLSYLGQIYSDKPSLQKEAQSYLSKILQQELFDFDLLRNIAYIIGGLNDKEESITYLEKSLSLNPQSTASLNNYALVLEEKDKQNLTKCIDLWVKTITLNPRAINPYLNLGLAYDSLQQNDESIFYYKKAIQTKRLESPYWKICRVYNRIGQFQESLYYSQKAVKNFPKEIFFQFLDFYYICRHEQSIHQIDLEKFESLIYTALNKGLLVFTQIQISKLKSKINQLYSL